MDTIHLSTNLEGGMRFSMIFLGFSTSSCIRTQNIIVCARKEQSRNERFKICVYTPEKVAFRCAVKKNLSVSRITSKSTEKGLCATILTLDRQSIQLPCHSPGLDASVVCLFVWLLMFTHSVLKNKPFYRIQKSPSLKR